MTRAHQNSCAAFATAIAADVWALPSAAWGPLVHLDYRVASTRSRVAPSGGAVPRRIADSIAADPIATDAALKAAARGLGAEAAAVAMLRGLSFPARVLQEAGL